jgi:hypothetical protein
MESKSKLQQRRSRAFAMLTDSAELDKHAST